MKLLYLPLLALSFLSSATAATLTLDNPNIAGTPGSTIGWGFTLTSTDKYMTIANVTLLPAPSIGTFSDLLAVRFPFEVGPSPAPSTTVTEAFDGLGGGLGSFAIDSGAAPGTVAFATLYVVYNLYNVSPNYDPQFDTFNRLHTDTEGLVFEVPVSVTVTGVPEPSTWALMAFASSGLLWWRRKAG